MASPCFNCVYFSAQRTPKKIKEHKIMSYLKRWGRKSLASLKLRVLVAKLRYPAARLMNIRLQNLQSINLLLDWGAAHRESPNSRPRIQREPCCDTKQHLWGHRESPPLLRAEFPNAVWSEFISLPRWKTRSWSLSSQLVQIAEQEKGEWFSSF